jgi:hypothetical protein
MNSFFGKLKVVFDKIPIKARFLKDLGFNISYSGFRYFMQGRKPTPSKKLMESMCDMMDYDLVVIPVKRDIDQQKIKDSLEDKFFSDLNNYLKKYENDPSRTYSKEFGKESSVAKALEAFSTEAAFDPNEKIDVSDLF